MLFGINQRIVRIVHIENNRDLFIALTLTISEAGNHS
jgi:hypothetical protein